MTDTSQREMAVVSCPECEWSMEAPVSGGGNGAWRLAIHAKKHKPKDDAPKPAPKGRPQPQTDIPSGSADYAQPESQPAQPKRSLKDRLLGTKADDTPKAPGRERTPATPKYHGPRQPTHDLWERLWGWGGRRVERNFDVGVGRALQLESGAAGGILESAVKDTMLDRPSQWAARNMRAGEAIGALLGLPVIVGWLERDPMRLPDLQDDLIDCMTLLGPHMFAAKKREAARQRDFAEAMKDAGPALGLPDGTEVTPEHLVEWLLPGIHGHIARIQAEEARKAQAAGAVA